MTSRLLKTPPELLDLIVAHLDDASLKQLRLTAKAFGSYVGWLVLRSSYRCSWLSLDQSSVVHHLPGAFPRYEESAAVHARYSEAIRTTVICLPKVAPSRGGQREARSHEAKYLAALKQMFEKATKLSHMELVIRVADIQKQSAGDAFWTCIEALCSDPTLPLKTTLILEGPRYLHDATLHSRTASHLARIMNLVSTRHVVQSLNFDYIEMQAEHQEFQQALSKFSPRRLYFDQCLVGKAIRESLRMDQLTHLSIFVDDETSGPKAHEARMARCAADLVHRAARSVQHLELKTTTPWSRDLASALGTLRLSSLRSFRCSKRVLLRIEAIHAPNAEDVEVLEDDEEMDFRLSDSEDGSEGSLGDEGEVEKRLEKVLLCTTSFPKLQRVALPTLLPGPGGIGEMEFVKMLHRFTSAGVQAKFGLGLTLAKAWVDRIAPYIGAISPCLSTLNLVFMDWPHDARLNAWKLPNLVHLDMQIGDATSFVYFLRNLDAPRLQKVCITSVWDMNYDGLRELLGWLRYGKTPNLGRIDGPVQICCGEKEFSTLKASMEEVCKNRGIDCRLHLERRAER